jgi:uncharacterized membrane protein YphA (DoxX/SURF4 family)
MNYRNKKLVITVRILLGLMFLGSGLGGLLAGSSLKGVPENMIPIMKSLLESGIFHMIKVTEVVSGLMLIFGLYPALATIFIAPVCVGIIVFNAMVSPENLWGGVVVGLPTIYLGYAYRDKYRPLFDRKG